MTAKAVLSAKGDFVATIDPTTDVAEAVKRLADHQIGALVVTGAGNRIVGILSERDIVHALAKYGPEALQRPLTDVMTRKVATCNPRDTVSSIMELMTDGKFRHVPVVESGTLVGIISIGDVVKHRLRDMENEQNALRDYIQTA